ncbi:hypothetical protein SAY86_019984 [Trapa natans]|uniref:Stigma-specific STIG1-like protein 1 n=1 Tax=Trapa natans TaxID=22666 RepID=A0AAN7M037_TRANT|nr:hypothetical protein SAY86_019984 [Trapa natans]
MLCPTAWKLAFRIRGTLQSGLLTVFSVSLVPTYGHGTINNSPHESGLLPIKQEYGTNTTDRLAVKEETIKDDGSLPLRGVGRFLAQQASYSSGRSPSQLTSCDRYPKVCKAKGSPGRDCCGKSCVDTKTDQLNCGKCGQRCKYSEICCKGKCVNPMSDKKHCGGCNNPCTTQKKGKCVYGMCNYA